MSASAADCSFDCDGACAPGGVGGGGLLIGTGGGKCEGIIVGLVSLMMGGGPSGRGGDHAHGGDGDAADGDGDGDVDRHLIWCAVEQQHAVYGKLYGHCGGVWLRHGIREHSLHVFVDQSKGESYAHPLERSVMA